MSTATAATAAPPSALTCEGRTGVEPGPFGFVPVHCQRRIGVLRWVDAQGTEHAGCAAHVRELEARFPMAWPGDLPEQADPVTAAKGWTDAGWSEAELREAFGG